MRGDVHFKSLVQYVSYLHSIPFCFLYARSFQIKTPWRRGNSTVKSPPLSNSTRPDNGTAGTVVQLRNARRRLSGEAQAHKPIESDSGADLRASPRSVHSFYTVGSFVGGVHFQTVGAQEWSRYHQVSRRRRLQAAGNTTDPPLRVSYVADASLISKAQLSGFLLKANKIQQIIADAILTKSLVRAFYLKTKDLPCLLS